MAQGTRTAIVLYDYAGNKVGRGNRNSNTDGTFSDFSFVYLPNVDALVYPVNDYDVTYASDDFGKTWQRVQTWGARGSTKPTALGRPERRTMPSSLPAGRCSLRDVERVGEGLRELVEGPPVASP